MTTLNNKVLVLGSDTRSFLTVIRSLGRAGKEVHVAWCARSSFATTSKYVTQVHNLVRPPALNWTTEFFELLQQEQFDLVIPCNDPSILPLHENRDLFSAFPIYLVDTENFQTVMDKAAVNRIAGNAGLKLPTELVIRSTEDVGEIEKLRSPYVLKPTQSYTAGHLAKKNHVVVASDLGTARERIEIMLEHTPVLVQEYFDGCGVGVEFIAWQGKVLTAFQHRRLHEPPDGGGSSYRKSCLLDQQLKHATDSLVNAIGYSGVGMAEYRYDFRRRDWIFVELNSRFWGSLPLAVACGADFPAYLYDLWCLDRRNFPSAYQVNRTSRNWMMDIQWLRRTLRANGLNIARQTQLAWQLLAELRYPLMLRETCDAITHDDPAPGVNEIKASISSIPQSVRQKIFRVKASLKLYRRWERSRLKKRLKEAKSVLFVCKGNICRSPFAEHYVRQHLNHFQQIDSCGYFPKSDRASPDNAVAAADQFDIELLPHRSSEISADVVDHSDVIFVFDNENYHAVRNQFPKASSKTFLLSWVNEGSELEIADPYGGAVDDFRQTYSQIENALKSLSRLSESKL